MWMAVWNAMSDDGLTSFESSLEGMLERLGLPDPRLMSRLTSDWDDIAGEPWRGRSRPITIQNRTLTVEANTPSVAAFLKYGKEDLMARIAERFGDGVIDRVEIRLPAR